MYCALFAHSEYKREVLALLLYLKSIGMPRTQLCWSYLLLDRERIIIIIEVIIIKIPTIKWGTLHLMKFHFTQIKVPGLTHSGKKVIYFRSEYTYLHNLLMYNFKPETILGANIIENTILQFNNFDVYSLA